MARVTGLFFLVVIIAAPLAGQQGGGRRGQGAAAANGRAGVRGAIRDRAEQPIAGARLRARAGQKEIAAVSESNGRFLLRGLAAGHWTLDIEKEGFQPFRKEFDLEAGRPIELSVHLARRGAQNETAALDVRPGEFGEVIDEEQLAQLPVGDRRTMNVVAITGASVFVGNEGGGKASFSLAGGRPQSQSFTLDGGNGQSLRLAGGQMDFEPSTEALSEVRVVSNGFGADNGGSASGLVAAKIKSGSNALRGSLYDYFRNDALDARNYFAAEKPPLRYNVFGGTFGGPVLRDRTYFFASYEGSRRIEGQARTLTVPTELQRAGDFSQTLNSLGRVVTIYDPATTRLVNGRYTRTPFAGNVIPAARFDPVAANLLPFFPAATSAGAALTGANNFTGNGGKEFVRDHLTTKIDHVLSARDRLSGRYLYDKNNQHVRSVFPNPAAENQTDSLANQHQLFASWTRTWRPALVSDLRFTWSHRDNHQTSAGLGGDWPAKLGLAGVPDDAFPRFVPNGFTGLGAPNQERIQAPMEQAQILAALTATRGRHAWKTGVEFRPGHNIETDLQTISGMFTFSPLATAMPGATGNSGGGNGLATMLLGFPTQFTQRATLPLDRASRYFAAYLQDDWRLRPNLSLSFGLRWEVDTAMRDANGYLNGFDTTAINPVSGTPGVVTFGEVAYRTDWNNVGPRFSFAWQPERLKGTVIRGGYGVFFAHPFDRSVTSAASLGYEMSARLITPDNGITAPFYLKDGVPVRPAQPVLDAGFGAVPAGQAPNTLVTFFETGRVSGYAQQFNFSLQRELPAGFVLETALLGNVARKLAGANLSINQIRPELMGPGATQALRPFPQFSDVQIIAPSLGISNYHGGVAKVERRGRSYSLLASYTFSKFLNNVDEGGGGAVGNDSGYMDYYNRRLDYGPSANDIRHRLAASGMWNLPWRLQGWSVGSVATLQSAPPFTVTTQANTTAAFTAGPLRPDVVGEATLADPTVAQWFNTAAFAAPAPYTFGNAGVNILRGDSMVNFDFSVQRTFAIRENWKLQFRGELFNAFNHASFGLPGSALGAADFGVVDQASPGRRVQLSLRLSW